MPNIQVDPDMLRWGANEYSGIAGSIEAIESSLSQATRLVETANSAYAAQIAGKLHRETVSASSEARIRAGWIEELSEWLRLKAEQFEEADRASREGLTQLMTANQMLMEQVGETPFIPLYLLNGTRPPDFDAYRWRHLPRVDREDVVRYYRQQWANFLASRTPGSFREPIYSLDYLEEMFHIYMYGLPATVLDPRTGQQREPFYPVNALFNKPELPDGTEAYPDRLFTKYQYQDLEAYLSDLEERGILDDLGLSGVLDGIKTANWSRAHYNLCGLDAAGYAVGVEHMAEAYLAFAKIDEPMLINNETTWTYQIRDLYREMGWEAEQIGRFASSEHITWLHWDENNRLAYPTFEQVEAKLEEGYVITPLVGVASATGYLTSNEEAATGHFIDIIETMKTRDGTELIRVYNSMHHREEIYTWDVFDDIWQHAGGNSGGQAVIARPPEVSP